MQQSVNHPSVTFGKTGVLLVNLGTPDALDYFSMRRYLKEFLMDPRVVEKNRLLWGALLNGLLLQIIPFRSRRNYAKIWDYDKNESPLRTITRAQAQTLHDALKKDETLVIDWAMRYGAPSIEERLKALQTQGCDKIVLLPLYPQYSAVTTASVCDAAFNALKKMRWMPSLHVIPPYFEHPTYIDALKTSVNNHLKTLDWQPDAFVTSYHGLPKRYFMAGDPYHCQCYKTSRLLKEALKLSDEQMVVSFQSRFGREEWLQPYTDNKLQELAQNGVKNIAVLTPGFAADCVETLEEIAQESKQTFLNAGGENFTFIPCLNDTKPGMNLLETLVQQNLFS